MNYSKLSDADLNALAAGNMQGISDAGLQHLAGEEPAQQPLNGVERGIGLLGQYGQGATFGFGDELAAAGATPVNMGISAMRGRPVGSIRGNYNALLDSGRELLDRTQKDMPITSGALQLAGGITGPAGAAFGEAKTAGGAAWRGAASGALYGAGDGTDTDSRLEGMGWGALTGGGLGAVAGTVANNVLPRLTPSVAELKALYRTQKEGLKNIPISADAVKSGLLEPSQNNVGSSIFAISGDAPRAALQDIGGFARRGANAYQVDEFRSQLGGSPLESRIRENVDDFMSGQGISTEFRRQYRLAKAAEQLQSAIDKGGDSVYATRTRLRTAGDKIKGLSPQIDGAIARAGRAGFAENMMRVGKLPGAILSAATGTGLNGGAGLGVYLGGRLLDRGAESLARGRMQDALSTILLDGKPMPNYAKRFGALTGRMFQ